MPDELPSFVRRGVLGRSYRTGLHHLLLFFVLIAPLTARSEPRTTTLEVARELVCDCPDCGKQSLDQCTDCKIGMKYRGEIAGLIQQGKSKQQILDAFADKHGEHMLGN